MAQIDIAGLKIDTLTKKELLSAVSARVESGQKTFITTPYSEFLFASLMDKKILEMLNLSDIAVADGIGIFWAAKFLQLPLTAKSYFGRISQAFWQMLYTLAFAPMLSRGAKDLPPEKIPGSDLVWDISQLAAEKKYSIFLLGGFGTTPKIVAEKLKARFPNLIIAGYSTKNMDDASVLDDIRKASADFLFVAYGPIRQERWIIEHKEELPSKLFIGLGGTFDYIAKIRTAPPAFIRSLGFEWLYRLITQPQRIKRIFHATFGLITALMRYKVFMSYPLRPNVVVVILNFANEILVCERDPKDFHIDIISSAETLKKIGYWQFPQGGIDPNEDIVKAGRREAYEETGLKDLELISVSKKTHSYSWNNAERKLFKNKNHKNPGQMQHIVYFKFYGDPKTVTPDNQEFINYQWAAVQQLAHIVHPERKNLTNIVMDDLNHTALL